MTNRFCDFLYSSYVLAQYINITSIDQKLMCPVSVLPGFLGCYLMAYSKANLKITGNKAFCFRQFCICNTYDRCGLSRIYCTFHLNTC